MRHSCGAIKVKKKLTKTEAVSKRVRNARGRGYAGEVRLAKLVGGKRTGLSKIVKLDSGEFVELGKARPDVLHEIFCFENKNTRSTPAWFSDLMLQTNKNNLPGKIPCAHIRDHRTGEYYFILREVDFCGLFIGEKHGENR